jgi:FixJ family two-component response regulator
MAQKRCRVFVIDDDESVRRSFGRLLRSEALDVETFSCPEEFLNSPMQQENACILIDLHLEGMTGFDLQQQLVSNRIKTPVIVISASDDVQTREHARQLGAVAFFRKPIDDQALLDAISWAVSGRTGGR